MNPTSSWANYRNSVARARLPALPYVYDTPSERSMIEMYSDMCRYVCACCVTEACG